MRKILIILLIIGFSVSAHAACEEYTAANGIMVKVFNGSGSHDFNPTRNDRITVSDSALGNDGA